MIRNIAALSIALAAAAHGQTTGLVPLNDLGTGTHEGFQGGLYPGGVNAPPAGHLSDALTKASEIVPRDAAGNPDPNGFIAMIAVGMSNTTHEFAVFERTQDANTARNARGVIVDTGFGGQTATVISDPTAAYWTTMQQRLTAMGLTAAQVQVAWIKLAESHPSDDFPVHAQGLRANLELVANNLHDKFPNLKIGYLSSRIYGGYGAPGGLNPEPQAYESGFAVKWLIEDQINGDTGLDYGQLGGPVRSPLLMWGPYLWADGTNPRSDGLVWLASDMESDNVHPSPAGEAKVAGMLGTFFASDPTAASWWPAQPGTTLVTVNATADAHVRAASPATNFGSSLLLFAQGGASPTNTYLRFSVPATSGPILFAKLSLRVNQNGGGRVSRVLDTTWGESTITFASAPSIGPLLVPLPQSSRDGTIGANVTSSVISAGVGPVSYALTSTAAGIADFHSREAGQAPRLVLVVAGSQPPFVRPVRK